MADAKSRYEIVESLTEQRQRVIDEIANTDNAIVNANHSISQMSRDHVRAVDDLKRKQVRELEDQKAKVESVIKDAGSRKKTLEAKERALVEAIDAIKSISANNEKTA